MSAERPTLAARLQTALLDSAATSRGERAVRSRTFLLPEPPPLYTAADVARLRGCLRLSQSQFAQVLHVSHKTVQSWEQGQRHPSHSAARLLQILEKPDVLAQITDAASL